MPSHDSAFIKGSLLSKDYDQQKAYKLVKFSKLWCDGIKAIQRKLTHSTKQYYSRKAILQLH